MRASFLKLSGLLAAVLLLSVLGCQPLSPLPPLSPSPTPIETPPLSQIPATVALKPVLAADFASADSKPASSILTRDYAWTYRGTNYTWRMELPESLYLYYKNRARPPTRFWSIYVTHPADDRYIDGLAAELSEAARQAGFGRPETAQFVANFIQSLPYTSDDVSTGYDEYPRYPIQTLVDNGGDCEDTSILAGAVLKSMGYEVALLRLPGHMAITILGDESFSGVGYPVQAGHAWAPGKYYYLETTGEGWAVGEMPPQHAANSAKNEMYFTIPTAYADTHFKSSWRGTSGSITITVTNIGTATMNQAYVLAGFDSGDMILNPVKSTPFDLAPDAATTNTLDLKVPQGKHTRFIVQVIYVAHPTVALDTVYSDWFDT